MLDQLHSTCDAARVAAVWRSVQPTRTDVRRAHRRLHAKAWFIAMLFVGSYWVLVITDAGLWLRLAAALMLSTAVVTVGTGIMHDANHGSFSTHSWLNRTLAYTSDALGASSWLWRIQHNNLHHGNTNFDGVDADLDLAPFARLTPSQPWHSWYRAQHFYMWPLYGFLVLKNFLVSDFVALATGRMGTQPLPRRVRARVIAQVVLGKLGHATWALVIPFLFNPWWRVLLFYVGCSWIVGFTLAIVFQLAHCVDVTVVTGPDAPRRGSHFAEHQMLTTANVASPVPLLGGVFRWLVGGLDNQIEHHLAPRLPHTIYRQLARRFQRACRDNGITYHVHRGVCAAVRSHAHQLRIMSVAEPHMGLGTHRGVDVLRVSGDPAGLQL